VSRQLGWWGLPVRKLVAVVIVVFPKPCLYWEVVIDITRIRLLFPLTTGAFCACCSGVMHIESIYCLVSSGLLGHVCCVQCYYQGCVATPAWTAGVHTFLLQPNQSSGHIGATDRRPVLLCISCLKPVRCNLPWHHCGFGRGGGGKAGGRGGDHLQMVHSPGPGLLEVSRCIQGFLDQCTHLCGVVDVLAVCFFSTTVSCVFLASYVLDSIALLPCS